MSKRQPRLAPRASHEMTDPELRKAVAELRGWKPPGSIERDTEVNQRADDIKFAANANNWWLTPTKSLSSIDLAPDYPNDLNAIREAVYALEPVFERPHYVLQLRRIVARDEGFLTNGLQLPDWHLVNANAKQRCEAFIATMSTEEDDETLTK